MAESEPIVIIAQPSTKTNNNSLKGSEINIGESIIIPSDIRMEAITISITRNGKKIRKPISNAVLSSEVIKQEEQLAKELTVYRETVHRLTYLQINLVYQL